MTSRFDSAASYEGIYLGGESTLRGYPQGALPRTRDFTANNDVLFSAEYRLPVWATPSVDLSFLPPLIPGMNKLYYRIDAAALFDAGYLWHYLPEIIHPHTGHDYGLGAGFAIRIMAPTMRRSGCIDFAWGLDRDWRDYIQQVHDSRMREYNEKKRDRKPLPVWVPDVYIYLDLPY
jgi:outer membrane protein assembly factor BamA